MATNLVPRAGGPPISLDKPIVLIGRHQDCDAVLQASAKVSRRHCCIVRVDNRFVVRDLGSMNGIRLNGSRIFESDLASGDELAIGDQFFVVQMSSPEGQKAPAAPKKVANGQHPAKPAVAASPPPDLSLEYPVAIPEPEDPDGPLKTFASDDDLPNQPHEAISRDEEEETQPRDPSDSQFDFMRS